ncbi:hypothetical protein D3C86_1302050 [compost metagenome]
MPVRIDKVPPPLAALAAPRAWLWLLLLLVLLLSGLGLTLWLWGDVWADEPNRFWLVALGIPFMGWCVLGFGRAMAYLGESSSADGWNDAREADLIQTMRQGRRSQQVLVVSLHTALRGLGAPTGEAQREALHNGDKALTVQPDWQGSEEGSRHSRLATEQGELPKALLRRVLQQALSEIATVLESLQKDKPLSLLLEMNCSIADDDLNETWQAVWAESGIRQTATRIEGNGLAVVDHWLDQRIHDQALMLVVAMQLAPAEVEGSAETVVALLFGNRLTQTTLQPLAYLHRPEQARASTVDALLCATRQALDWVPVEASSIRHAWLAGTDAERTSAITMTLSESAMPVKASQGLHGLNATLGDPGCTAPWVAIAAAVESIREEGNPHFMFSGDNSTDTGLWCSVVMPPPLKQEKIADAQ